jgi:hypothetical protein
MNNNAVMRQQSATEPARGDDHQAGNVQGNAQRVPADTAVSDAPDLTVVGRLHKMFALLAVR